MNHRTTLPALAISLTLVAGMASAAGASGSSTDIQQWTDENGVVHYGNAPPPEAMSRERSLLNRQGVPVKEFPRQLTPTEAEAQKRKTEEDARRKAQDSFLLNTYTRVGDIERVRDEQLALIDSQIELARGSLATSEQRVQSIEKRMASFLPYSDSPKARPLPDNLAGEAIHALGERGSMLASLAQYEQRKIDTRAKFQADITRYLELTNRPSIR